MAAVIHRQAPELITVVNYMQHSHHVRQGVDWKQEGAVRAGGGQKAHPAKGRGILVLSFLLTAMKTAMKPGYFEIVPSGKFSGWQKKCILGRLIDNWRKYCFRCNKSVTLFIYHKGQLQKVITRGQVECCHHSSLSPLLHSLPALGRGGQTDRQTSPVGAQLRAGCLCWVLLSCAGARVLLSGESKPTPSLPPHAASNHFSSVL